MGHYMNYTKMIEKMIGSLISKNFMLDMGKKLYVQSYFLMESENGMFLKSCFEFCLSKIDAITPNLSLILII